ncbi:hypothetical protein MO867_01525 [Microbulbifer sp. OS29]|uniref:Uncharacterized protein n=1 Tax=Microbulbifer okhotskensis TaxID=2926617 RepID=A0A9X2EJV0_9GAMM|nr:hypothetical protein [Microbulbifer okhotskensis]MCO1333009.1 hypothetical protein [Microbulbifer okhotskensis]
MLNKSQSISARLSAVDYNYLMSIDRNGAITQSEKVRELIAMARDSTRQVNSVQAYLSSAEALLPLKARYLEESQRSLLIEAVLELLAESAAVVHNSTDCEPIAPVLERNLLPAVDAFLEKMVLLSRQGVPRSIHRETAEKIRHRLELETAD